MNSNYMNQVGRCVSSQRIPNTINVSKIKKMLI